MRRRMLVLIACLALSVTAWAGDPWKEKSYKEWDEKEVNKILNDSPWARVVTVPAFWRGSTGSGEGAGGRSGGGAASGEGGGAAEQIGGRVASGAGDSGGVALARYIVRWGSARTARQARARLALLKGSSEAEVEKFLQEPVTDHHLVLYGPDMAPFAKSDEISLMERTSLKLKKNKQKIAPIRVEIERSRDGKRIASIIFHFAMKSETGEPIIAADEKGVEFECRTDSAGIRANFEPQKMVAKAGPDLQVQ